MKQVQGPLRGPVRSKRRGSQGQDKTEDILSTTQVHGPFRKQAGDRRGDRHVYHATQAGTEGPGLSLRTVP